MLQLFQSNRLETLLELLAVGIKRPPGATLAPDTVIVQSQGMGRWISLKLAEKHGVCANLHFPLPATFQWELLRAVFGELPLRSAFSSEAMTFRIMDWLSRERNLERVPKIGAYLSGGEDLRRFELAGRIADLFDQYLVYRPDWIDVWERGETLGLGADENWQATLWRDVAASTKESHRVDLTKRLLHAIERGEVENRLPERLMLFGISSLPPVFLQIMKILSQHREVALFALNPCRLPWGEILDSREIAKLAGKEAPEDLYLNEGNPLLASLGKQGREFFDCLLEESPEIHELFDEGGDKTSLLHGLQKDILDLVDRGGSLTRSVDVTMSEMGEQGLRTSIAASDRSLQIHVCHSPMREVEVLRDQLLAMFDADSALNPADIAVLTPNIALYAPYIEAVFGTAEDAMRIPFAIADRGAANDRVLVETFLSLLDLPSARFEADWVLDFLELDFVRNRFELGEDDLPVIHHWVHETGIRWGRDANHRASLGLPAESRHSWREGLTRLLLGYALPKAAEEDGIPLFEGILPFDDLEGETALAMGRFAEYANTLMDFSTRLQASLPLVKWADLLLEMLEGLFAPSPEDLEGTCQRLRDALDTLGELADLSGFNQAVAIPVVKRWLTEQFNTESGGGFLHGGVTFCAMVPMRSLPFKVICLLGLNDDAFPRRQRPAGFDLIARQPRRGDRSRRLDDRYLFLETILSAREILYISYVGRNIRDNGVLPPSVLVADLLDVVRAGFAMEDGSDCLQHILTMHSLQAFNPAYFRDDPRRPGYSSHWLEAARLAGARSEARSPFFQSSLPEPEEDPLNVDLERLAHFFSNPARYLLRNRLGIVLEAGEDAVENREPFGLDFFDKEILRNLALNELRGELPPQASRQLAEASGVLPHGSFGRALFAREASAAERAASNILPLLEVPMREPLPLNFDAAGVRLNGVLAGVTTQGLIRWRLQSIGPRDLFDLWIRHLALCLLRPDGVECRSFLAGEKQTIRFAMVKNAAEEIAKLLAHFRNGLCHPLPFFVKSAWEYVETREKKGPQAALKAAHRVWDVPDFRIGNGFGESENPYYQLVFRDADPLDAKFEQLASEVFNPMRAAIQS